MNKKSIIITAIALVVIAIPLFVLAGGQGRGFGHGPMRGPGGHGMGRGPFAMLNLSDDQKTKIDAIHNEVRPAMEELRTKLAEGRKQFDAANQPGVFDETAARAFADAQGKLMADVMVLEMQTQAKIYQVLTPEQQARFKELRSHRGDRQGFRHP